MQGSRLATSEFKTYASYAMAGAHAPTEQLVAEANQQSDFMLPDLESEIFQKKREVERQGEIVANAVRQMITLDPEFQDDVKEVIRQAKRQKEILVEAVAELQQRKAMIAENKVSGEVVSTNIKKMTDNFHRLSSALQKDIIRNVISFVELNRDDIRIGFYGNFVDMTPQKTKGQLPATNGEDIGLKIKLAQEPGARNPRPRFLILNMKSTITIS